MTILHGKCSIDLCVILYERNCATRDTATLETTDHNIRKSVSILESLAELQFLHLRYQRNEANIPADIDPDVLADDFIRKFVARFLFRKTVRD
jgi:hypothetical protein